MAEYQLVHTGAEIDAAVSLAETALQAADMATTVSLAASAVQPAYTGTFALTGNETISGNLTFLGTGNRIAGDFSNSTIGNRCLFQGAVSGPTRIGIIPNANTNTDLALYNSSTPDTAGSRLIFNVSSTITQLSASVSGTGSYLPIRFTADNTTALTITASGTSTAGSNPLVLIRATTTTDTVTPLQVTGAIKHSVYAAASLPTGTAGCRSFVSDSNATLAAGLGNIVAGGGANFVPVHHNGTNWIIG